MYKVSFIDDESSNFELLEKLVAWEEKGFSICWKATDGSEALSRFEQERPDMMIVDISMPIMDGLEFARLIREADRDVQIVLLSAFSDFSFAQRAIRHGVQDYLVKPVSRIQLNQLADAVRARLDASRAGPAADGALARRERENAMRELARALCAGEERAGPAGGERWDALLSEEGLARVCFFHPDGMPVESGEMRALAEFLETFLTERGARVRLLVPGERGEVWLSAGAQDALGLFSACLDALGAFRENLSADFYPSEGDARALFERVREGLCPGFYQEEGALYPLSAAAPRGALAQFLAFEEILGACFQSLSPDAAQEAVRGLLRASRAADTAPNLVKNELLELLIQIKMRMTLYFKHETFRILRHIRVERIMQEEKAAALERYVCGVLGDAFESLKGQLQQKDRRYLMVCRANRYVEEHFCEQELMTQQVAQHVGLSKNYFVTLYKEFSGRGFWEFVTELRMERAKTLLAQTDLAVGEIARAVGYESEFHFSRKFREAEGLPPRDYRSRAK